MISNRELHSVLDFLKVEPDNGYLQMLVLEWIEIHDPFVDVSDIEKEFHSVVGDNFNPTLA